MKECVVHGDIGDQVLGIDVLDRVGNRISKKFCLQCVSMVLESKIGSLENTVKESVKFPVGKMKVIGKVINPVVDDGVVDGEVVDG